jgi:thiamine-monophosphate kinase
MLMLDRIRENELINSLAKIFPRSPYQVNALHGSDSEIIRIPGASGQTLAATIDTIAEEIRTGLYTDPWLIGWMTVMVNMSDLAAVGASPIGILVSEIIPPDFSAESRERLQKGILDACTACGTFVLGGDTNAGSPLSTGGCGLGLLPEGSLLSRTECAKGDRLYTSGYLGDGNAFAASRLIAKTPLPYTYQPVARLREGSVVRHFASCCMDSSDGVLATLDQLMRLNGCGFSLGNVWEKALSPQSVRTSLELGIPPWLLLAGEHGEFELIFTIPPSREKAFLDEAANIGWAPLRLGDVIPTPEIRMFLYDYEFAIDTEEIRNLGSSSLGPIEKYLKSLLEIDFRLRQGRTIV